MPEEKETFLIGEQINELLIDFFEKWDRERKFVQILRFYLQFFLKGDYNLQQKMTV